MGSANTAPNAATNFSSTHQPNIQAGSSNQVRVGDACHQLQPALPRHSSSCLPTLRRRASEPLPHGYRQRLTQRPGETHTRYTYGFKQTNRGSSHTSGFTQKDNEYSCDEGRDPENTVHRSDARSKFGFVSNCQKGTCSNGPAEGNLNREKHRDGYTQERNCSHAFADTQGHIRPDNTHGQSVADSQDNTQQNVNVHTREARHSRSRTLYDIHRRDTSCCSSYTENIRAMAGQMYGDPPTHSRIYHQDNRNAHRYIDAHSHNYVHNRAMTRKHIWLSDGLWWGVWLWGI